jgi:uncharacterized protein (DUF433 family)
MFDKQYIEEIIFYWSTGMSIEAISDLLGISQDDVNEILDIYSDYV